jgi:hypothetical protein
MHSPQLPKRESGLLKPAFSQADMQKPQLVFAQARVKASSGNLPSRKISHKEFFSEMPNSDSSITISKIDRVSLTLRVQDQLPVNLTLERNDEIRTLSLLSADEPRTLAQQRFTKNEWSLLMPLLDYYPYYVPHELLLSVLTSLSPDDCRQLLDRVRLRGSDAIVQELKPVYRALSGTRAKLKRLHPGLTISLIRTVGYALTLAPEYSILKE